MKAFVRVMVCVLAAFGFAALARAAIGLVGVTTVASTGAGTPGLSIAPPGASAAGDLLIAQITVRGAASITVPAGWTPLRTDARGSTMRQTLYYRFATAAEPPAYAWLFGAPDHAAGAIAAYRGVDASAPFDASAGADHGSSSEIETPDVSRTLGEATLAGFFGLARATSVTVEGSGLTERYDVASAGGSAGVTIALADGPLSAGDKLKIRADAAAQSIAQVVVLKPAAVLRADYRFDECGYSGAAGQVRDSAGAFHATPRNGLNTSAPGVVQRFGNLDTYARWAQSSIPLASDWSVTVWFKAPFSSPSGTSQYHVLGSVAGGGDLMYLDRNAGFRWGVYTRSGLKNGSFRFGTLAAGWHHLALIGKGKKTYLYIDGALRDSVSRKTTGTLTYLGTSYDNVNTGSAQGFRAPIDELMVWDYALNDGQIAAIRANQAAGNDHDGSARAAVACFDHFRISHAAAAVNCQAEPVTFSAHDALHGEGQLAAGTVISIATSTLHGNWSLVSGTGSLADLGGGAARYTVAGAESSFVLALSDTYAETVDIDVAAGAVTEHSGTAGGEPGPGSDPALVFAPAGFRFVDASGSPIGTQVSGKTSATHALQAIQSTACTASGTCTGACTALFPDGSSVAIDIASECVDPVSCSPGRLVTLSTGAETRAVPSNAGGGVSAWQATSFLFGANASAPFTLNFPDAGRIRLHARRALADGNSVVGESSAFVVRPFGFALAAPGNPGAADATGPAYRKAGEPFGVTVTAVAWSAADDADGDGIPDAGAALGDNAPTPGFGREAVPETVSLGHVLVAPTAGYAGTLAGGLGVGGFVDGSASASLSFSEAGVIRLVAGLSDASYLDSGQDVSGTSGPIGRFYPDHFALLPGASLVARADIAACADAFTYMGEPFRLDFALEARNGADAITRNYRSSADPALDFAKLDVTVPASFRYAAANGSTDLSARLDRSNASSGSWSAGQALIQAPLAFARAAAPDGPYPALAIGIDPVDTDGVRLTAFDMTLGSASYRRVATADLRFGRLRLSNAYGSERLALPVRAQLQYFSGSGFVANAADSCTRLAASDVALVFPADARNHLAACETQAALSAGAPATLRLTAPGAGNDGWTDLRINLGAAASGSACASATPSAATTANKPYLRGNWSGGAWDKDPSARAIFGVYRNANEFIYHRENY